MNPEGSRHYVLRFHVSTTGSASETTISAFAAYISALKDLPEDVQIDGSGCVIFIYGGAKVTKGTS